jgi:mRNA-degrading endonuclease toxin of MazEF toxin-antitoxin module
MSRDSVNERLRSTIGVPLTSRLQKANSRYRPAIPGKELSAEAGYTLADSVALCDHVREIAVERILGKAGTATLFAMSLIENGLAWLIAGDP